MRFPIQKPKSLVNRETARDDAMAGLVLGVESVPDGLASGLLAGVNPVAGLYAYMFGLAGGALFTSTAFMAVQGTGAMAIIVADVDIASREDPTKSLVTLSILTGVVMVVAGLLRLGTFLRFVSNSVMTGFITAVGLNIVLGQLSDFTGYDASGANRISRTFNLIFNFWRVDLATLVVGVLTIALIVVLQKTRLGALGLVVAIVVGSAVSELLNLLGASVANVGASVDVPRTLPFITAPSITEIPVMIVPAVSLAFVGLVQGAGVSVGFPNEDGSPQNQSQDFVGQGAGNIAAGLFQGMPVGGSMSASSLMTAAGAKTRSAAFYAAGVMAVVILVFGAAIEFVAMPSLAGLLIVVGISTVKPDRVKAVARTGNVPFAVMTTTLVLTLLIPLQYAVLVGVGISTLLFMFQQSTYLVLHRLVLHDDGRLEEVEVPTEVGANEVITLQPYGALFFATAATLRDRLPAITDQTRNSVVVMRIRGADDAGTTVTDMIQNYAEALRAADCKLMLVTRHRNIIRQLRVTGAIDVIGKHNVYHSSAFIGETTRRAHDDAAAWIGDHERKPPADREEDADLDESGDWVDQAPGPSPADDGSNGTSGDSPSDKNGASDE